jgi:hypothetical protein
MSCPKTVWDFGDCFPLSPPLEPYGYFAIGIYFLELLLQPNFKDEEIPL